MSKTISLIQRVQIASPCTADWNAMTGDERVRFCDQCKLNAYNLSEMSERDAEKLIIEKEGKLCARIYRRRDGTVITRDCPLGWKAIRCKTLRLCVQTAAVLLAIAAATAYAIGPKKPPTFGLARDPATGQWLGVLVERSDDHGVFRQAGFMLKSWLDEGLQPPLAFTGEPAPLPMKKD